uniref:Uncharacterized protein n=1 Tax=Neogobius melanostomus TaxID=47308 RepID=A0A8C6TV08_9GOBI
TSKGMDSSDAGKFWKSKSLQAQKNKQNMNILLQEKLIAQKKREIEEKLARQAQMNAQASSKSLQPR